MTVLGVRYLSGYAAAMDLTRQLPEWPVHPGRVFLALAAAFFESGPNPVERGALEWLESQPPPRIYAGEGCARSAFKAFVPVNDSASGIFDRSRQERSFPKTWLADDTVYLYWDADAPEPTRAALAQACRKVTRIGHSASVVQMWVAEADPPVLPNWLPDDFGQLRLRVPGRGTVNHCETAFNGKALERYFALTDQSEAATGKKEKQLKALVKSEFPAGRPQSRRPVLSRWQGYTATRTSDAAKESVPGPFESEPIVLAKVEGSNLGLEATLALTGALRNRILSLFSSPAEIPEWVSGHAPDGSPTRLPHLACFPLPFVERKYADGHVMGLAIAIPRSASPEIRALAPLLFDPATGEDREIEIWTSYWKWKLQKESSVRSSWTLDAKNWTRPSRVWASVTPVVLHHHPKKNRPSDVERIVREAFDSALLPQPESVVIRPVSYFEGAGHARAMPVFDEGGPNLSKYQTHVVAEFSTDVVGPVLVGRGRFRGYGLFRPVT